MSLSGINKLCQQCVRECKQFSQNTVIKCKFESNQKGKQQKKSARSEKGDTLHSCDDDKTGALSIVS